MGTLIYLFLVAYLSVSVTPSGVAIVASVLLLYCSVCGCWFNHFVLDDWHLCCEPVCFWSCLVPLSEPLLVLGLFNWLLSCLLACKHNHNVWTKKITDQCLFCSTLFRDSKVNKCKIRLITILFLLQVQGIFLMSALTLLHSQPDLIELNWKQSSSKWVATPIYPAAATNLGARYCH